MPSETINQIATVIKGIAPTIATVFGGPGAGALVGLGLNTLGKFLGIPEENPTAETVLAAVQVAATDPATRLQIMAAENDFALKMKGLELEELKTKVGSALEEIKVSIADVQSARTTDLEKTRITGKRDVNLYALAWVMMAGFFGLIGVLLWRAVPPDQSGVIFMLFGSLAAGFAAVISYFFGSSAGSKAKDDLLYWSAPNPPGGKKPG